MDRDKLIEQLRRHEGEELEPYQDTVGKWTVGIGRNFDDVGFSTDELRELIGEGISSQLSETLLENDIKVAQDELEKVFDAEVLDGLDDARHNVLINMIFNMGRPRLSQFRMMIAAVNAGDWNEAADQMIDSRWYRQVGNRAVELVAQMRTGDYQE